MNLNDNIRMANTMSKSMYFFIGIAILLFVSLIIFSIYRFLVSGKILEVQNNALCALTGLTMYCDTERNQMASDVSNQIGNPYEDDSQNYSLLVRSIVQRFYEAINKPLLMEAAQLQEEICPLYEDMLKLKDDELREVAALYRSSYSKTIRKEIGETFLECSSVQTAFGWVSPVVGLYNAFYGVADPGEELLNRLNKLKIP